MTTIEGSLVPSNGQAPKKKQRDWTHYRLPKRETPEAYAVYLRYRGMGRKRSLSGLCELLQTEAANLPEGSPDRAAPHFHTLARWSRAFNWEARIREYDEEQARIYEAKWEERRQQMNEEHYGIARNQALLATGKLDERIRTDTLGDTALVGYLKLMLQTQRTAAGEPTEVTEQKHIISGKAILEHDHVVNPRDMTDEQLESFRELALAMKRQAEEEEEE